MLGESLSQNAGVLQSLSLCPDIVLETDYSELQLPNENVLTESPVAARKMPRLSDSTMVPTAILLYIYSSFQPYLA